MRRGTALMAVCFSGGLLGGLFSSLAVWLVVELQLPRLAQVTLQPDFTPAWLYPRLVWGGIWGLVYFLTVGGRSARSHWIRKGLWMALVPSAVQLFYVFPYTTPHGMLGTKLGTLMPAFVLIFNLVWGFFTGLFTRLLWGRD